MTIVFIQGLLAYKGWEGVMDYTHLLLQPC